VIIDKSSGPLIFKADLHIISNLKFDIVLGTPWFTSVNPLIDWKARKLKFERADWSQEIQLNVINTSRQNLENEKLGEFDLKERSSNKFMKDINHRPQEKNMDLKVRWKDPPSDLSAKELSLKEEKAVERNQKDEELGDSDLKERSSNKILKDTKTRDKAFSQYYSDYEDLFVSKEIDSLPPNRPCDLEIKLKDEGKIPPFLKIYRLARKEEDLLKVFIEENLRKGFIRPSKSPYGAPIFFVPKPHSTELRPCINYKLLNENTVPDGRPLPLVSDILSQFEGSQIYTCLDLKGA
jgi:hypothetical protein